jgi:hypothetical protein
VQWNTVVKTGNAITLALTALSTVAENYLADNARGCLLPYTHSVAPDVAHNLFSHNWLKNNAVGISMGADPEDKARQSRNFAPRNVYEMRQGGRIAQWPSGPYTNLAAFQQATGQEAFGTEARINPDDLGMAWVRVDGLDVSHEVIPMFGNPGCERLSCLFDADPYFWTRGIESDHDSYPAYWRCGGEGWDVYPGVLGGLRPGCERARGVAGYLDTASVSNTPVGGKYLAVGALPGYGFGTNGLGWWSPCLPVAGGAVVDVGFWMRTDDVQPIPTAAGVVGGGAVAYVEWSNWTGQDKSRSYLVGGEIGGKPARPELTTGTHPWTEVKGSATVPAGARRMALFLGARSCAGKVGFDGIRTFAARPGLPGWRRRAGATPEGQPLVDPATLRFFEISLSNAVNRTLWDDLAGSGNGWQDRGGPGWDLRHVGVGRKTYGGVPFTVLSPRSCLVLDPHYRPEGKLPRNVTIPVNRKADVLCFLHTGTWLLPGPLPTGADSSWAYVVDYGNGYQRIAVVPGVNVRDWGAAGARRFTDTKDMRTTAPFEPTGGASSPVAGIVCMEWVNPRKNDEIKGIAVHSGDGVPIILAITGGTRLAP